MTQKYNNGLDKNPANHSALTPLSFLQRSATVFPRKTAVIDDDMSLSYETLFGRCCQMASALKTLGITTGDTVAVLCPNSHEVLESHYSVPMCGAVLNTLNFRLDATSLEFILDHGEARVLFYDTEFEALVKAAIAGLEAPPVLVSIERNGGVSEGLAQYEYETLLASAAPTTDWQRPADEWDAISLNYTSGTTGNPKGVVYHHRGAYLAAMSDAMAFNMSAATVYLWTLPMFHCNGWAYTWAITAIGGTHVCLRSIDTQVIHQRIERYGVTHMCGAPIVMNMLLNELGQQGKTLSHSVQFALGGAAPPSSVIRKAQAIGFAITHLYGLTESYGPATLCVPQPEWSELSVEELAARMARQGVATLSLDEVRVCDPATGKAVAADGKSLGEIQLRGNTLMKGYLKNPATTAQAFAGGWFSTGDLAVMHPDHYVEIKDRSKDIIISGGENISSLEVEEVLYQHPNVAEAAVIAIADEKWGEVPCAFISRVTHHEAPTEADVMAFCKQRMARFKVPKKVIFGELPKTATGKIRKNVLRDQFRDE